MLVVLATAGAGALVEIEPITIAIVVLLVILVLSYRRVIEAYPDGDGSYAASKANLGPRASHLAAASLVLDYVLTVAVSIAAGIAALVSAFPVLRPDSLLLALGTLGLLTARNLRGIATSARTFLLLQTFANGCSALTGIEAIANGVLALKAPRARRAMRTEVLLGALLGTMLLGLAFLTVRFHIGPVASQTVLSQITAASVGRGTTYDVIDLSTTVILALAANTSFGGLPVLASLLARDGPAPHVFGLRADRPVYQYGVVVLAILAGVLLVAVDADTNALIPLYAIGVFTGFTLAQAGLVRHWFGERRRRWWARAALSGTGAAMTALATAIFVVTKFSSGAWVVLVAIPGLILLFSRISRYYTRAESEMRLGTSGSKPGPRNGLVLVTVTSVSRMTEACLTSALSLAPRVVAVSVQFDEARAAGLRAEWDRWDPGVELVVLPSATRSIATPILEYLSSAEILATDRVLVLIPEVEPRKWRHRLLQNQRDVILSNALRQRTHVIMARVPFRLEGGGAGPRLGGTARGPGRAGRLGATLARPARSRRGG